MVQNGDSSPVSDPLYDGVMGFRLPVVQRAQRGDAKHSHRPWTTPRDTSFCTQRDCDCGWLYFACPSLNGKVNLPVLSIFRHCSSSVHDTSPILSISWRQLKYVYWYPSEQTLPPRHASFGWQDTISKHSVASWMPANSALYFSGSVSGSQRSAGHRGKRVPFGNGIVFVPIARSASAGRSHATPPGIAESFWHSPVVASRLQSMSTVRR